MSEDNFDKLYLDEWEYKEDNTDTMALIFKPKIVNGSLLSIGDTCAKTMLIADQHFNWFQKLMWKRCFGIKVEDYSEE